MYIQPWVYLSVFARCRQLDFGEPDDGRTGLRSVPSFVRMISDTANANITLSPPNHLEREAP